MFNLNKIKRVFLATYKVDFRKSYDGLMGEAYRMGLNPLAGDVILFFSQNGIKLKVLFCDSSGVCVLNKRLYKRQRRRNIKYHINPAQTEISRDTLASLIEGGTWNKV